MNCAELWIQIIRCLRISQDKESILAVKYLVTIHTYVQTHTRTRARARACVCIYMIYGVIYRKRKKKVMMFQRPR